jgi:hypothetical protein
MLTPLVMDTRRTDLVIQYALAVAGEADDYRERELGPIHLLKYVYLGDLASAQAGQGSFTGVCWRFYKFGPWAPDVLNRIEPAVTAIGAQKRLFQSRYKEEDAVRWRAADCNLTQTLEHQLPWEVARAIKSAVRRHFSDTASLLQEVYTTPPMLRAAPGEFLQLELPESHPQVEEPHNPASLPALSRTQVKELQKLMKERMEQRRRDKAVAAPYPEPRYDEVFAQGQDWLDGLAGEPVQAERGKIHFSDAVWKSPGRRDPEIP